MPQNSFKLWLEIVELKKPSSKTKKQTVIKDKGTNVARPMIQYQWTTKLGNNVKLQLEPKYPGSYEVVFYVNDTLYDFASKKEGYTRDAEILSNVFYTLRQKADKLGAKELTFRAYKGEKDDRVVKGLDINKYKVVALSEANRIKQEILSKEPEWSAPSPAIISLYQKIKREVPKVVQHKVVALLNDVIEKIERNEEITRLIYELETKNIFTQTLKLYNDTVLSNFPMGLTVHRNRRKEIYERILKRDFQNWSITIDGDRFVLSRK